MTDIESGDREGLQVMDMHAMRLEALAWRKVEVTRHLR